LACGDQFACEDLCRHTDTLPAVLIDNESPDAFRKPPQIIRCPQANNSNGNILLCQGPYQFHLARIADSIENYNDALSRELTRLTVEANLEVRELGFKPYLAPAISSGAMSVLRTLRGQWHYSSVYLGEPVQNDEGGSGRACGAFLGVRNRIAPDGHTLEYEDLPLPEELFLRIETAYENLCGII